MAYSFSDAGGAEGQLFRTASGFAWNAPYTVIFNHYWRSSTFYPTIFGASGPSGAYEWMGLESAANGIAVDVGGGASSNFVSSMGGITASVWQQTGLVRASVNSIRAVLNGALGAVANTSDATGRAAMDRFSIGSFTTTLSANPNDAIYSNLIIYERALTLAELDTQRRFMVPQFGQPWAWYPLERDFNDYSGNGRNLSSTGTVTLADNPPVLWDTMPWVVQDTITDSGLDIVKVIGETVSISETVQNLVVFFLSLQSRMSAINWGLPFGRLLPPPDSSITLQDRIQLAYLYSGITPSGVDFIRVINETIAATENSLRVMAFVRQIAETEAITESVVRLRSYLRSIGETEAISESIIQSRTLARVISEALSISETLIRARTMARLINETEAITENILRLRLFLKIISETVAISEVIARARTLARLVSETVSISENIQKNFIFIRQIAETETITESVSRLRVFIRSISETVAISENTLNIVQSGIITLIEVIDENIGLSETSQKLIGMVRWVAETETISENVARSRTLARVVDEIEQISEQILRARNMLRLITENVVISETIVKLKNIFKFVGETVEITETVVDAFFAGISELIQVINETVTVSEAIIKLGNLRRFISENINIVESVQKSTSFIRFINEIENIVDNISGIRGIFKIVNEIISIAESTQNVMGVAAENIEKFFKGMYKGMFRGQR